VKRSAAVPCDEDFVKNATPCPSTIGSCCATAELTEQYVGNGIVFNVGDGDTYGKYENTKLKAESTYDLYVAVTVDVEVRSKYSCGLTSFQVIIFKIKQCGLRFASLFE